MTAHDNKAPRVHDERREAVEGILATIGIFSFVFLVTLLYMWCGDLAFSAFLALLLFIFFLWPVVFLLDLLVEFVKALFRK